MIFFEITWANCGPGLLSFSETIISSLGRKVCKYLLFFPYHNVFNRKIFSATVNSATLFSSWCINACVPSFFAFLRCALAHQLWLSHHLFCIHVLKFHERWFTRSISHQCMVFLDCFNHKLCFSKRISIERFECFSFQYAFPSLPLIKKSAM